ncbi:MAG: alpha/beta hydrolase [Pirellulales bacterium]|nr:alpha/beta hydrolase [Pirellulales bacterium]
MRWSLPLVWRRGVIVGLLAMCGAPGVRPAVADDPEQMLLWPQGAPGAVGEEEVDRPSLTIYRPERDARQPCAVIVCPGGGYAHLAVDHEGVQIAEWLNRHGVTAALLRYRLAPRYHHPAPLADAQRAVRFVRSQAEAWGVKPDRIGMIGFSAGGHLVSSAATHFDRGDEQSSDAVDKQSCRPDFVFLGYPVVSFTTEFVHAGSRKNLLGDNPSEELVKLFSNELQVTPQTPPAFLVHSSTDAPVPPENSVLFYLAMRRAGVDCELHIFDHGPHGFGLGVQDAALAVWPELAANWMIAHGWIERR